MEKKYPAIKCNKNLWEEIKPILLDLGVSEYTYMPVTDYWDTDNYLVSNGGETWEDDFYMVNIPYDIQPPTEYLRYEVFTKEEFLEGIARLCDRVILSKKHIADMFGCYPEQLIFVD